MASVAEERRFSTEFATATTVDSPLFKGLKAGHTRREGYPPEGPRPRSGLGREARSRSDAPGITVPSGTPVSIVCTNAGIIVCTIVFIRARAAGGIVITGTFGADIVACHDARLMSGRA